MICAKIFVFLLFFFIPFSVSAGQEIIIGSGSQSGTYYPFAVSIANLLNSKLKVSAQGLSTGGSAKNNEELIAKKFHLAMIQNDIAFYAYEGLENIANNPDLRAIGSLYSEDVHIIVRADSGITTIEEMKGKRIAIGNPKSGQYRNAKQLLEEVGIFHLINKDYSKFQDAVSKLKNREIDGLFYTVGWPANGIMELTNEVECRFISLDESLTSKMVSEYPFYVSSFISTGTYKGLRENINTIAVRAMLVARADLEDSLAYSVSKLVFENIDYLQKNHPKWASVNLMGAQNGVGIPFHPGAEQYFKDNTIPVRERPFTGSPIIGFAKQGAKLNIFSDKWNRLKVQTLNGKKGWVEKKYITGINEAEINGYVVTASSLNFRRVPSLQGVPISLLFQGEKLEKIGEQYNPKDNITWFNVIRDTGYRGWTSSNYLREKKYNAHSGIVRIAFSKGPIQEEAENIWLNSTSWSTDTKGGIITQRINKLAEHLTTVDIEVLNEKLDLFEFKSKRFSSSGAPLRERLKSLEMYFDSKTQNSISRYITEIENNLKM